MGRRDQREIILIIGSFLEMEKFKKFMKKVKVRI
jgi:hypothetical protein